MVRFKIFNSSLLSNYYTATSGKSYRVTRNTFTGDDVVEQQDIDFFRAKGFIEEGTEPKETVKKPVLMERSYTEALLESMKASERIKILQKLKADKVPKTKTEQIRLILKLQK
jgi:hypothetical protein